MRITEIKHTVVFILTNEKKLFTIIQVSADIVANSAPHKKFPLNFTPHIPGIMTSVISK